MQDFPEKPETSFPKEIRTSFFTRKLSLKMDKMGSPIPPPVMAFLDTPLATFNDQQKEYFDQKFCPLIPNLISLLEEIFNELGADREGWEDMLTYSGKGDTPIKICARAVSAKKEKEKRSQAAAPGVGQQTKKIELPPKHDRISPSMV
jgi:hypothetical protein